MRYAAPRMTTIQSPGFASKGTADPLTTVGVATGATDGASADDGVAAGDGIDDEP
jgi:hypothetical protein